MTWTLDIENVAGIRDGRATIEAGPNAIRGANWQGKSSLLAAIEVAMGTDRTITQGQSRGRVDLETDDAHVTVELVRGDGGVRRDGEPYLPDERTRTAAALFAFLGEDNDVRRAVRAGENLEPLLTRPLEFENIDDRIADLVAERDDVDAELARAEDAASEVVTLEREVEDLADEVDDLQATRAELLQETDGGEVATQREELATVLAERDEVATRIERLERSIERTRETLEQRRATLADLEVPETGDDLADRLAEARERHDRARRDAELVQSVYAPTKRILDEGRVDLVADVDRDLVADALDCWTCGQETTREAVEESVARLSERVTELRERANAAAETVDDLETTLEERRAVEREREDLERDVAERAATLDERETSLRRARERLADLEATIDELSTAVESADERLTEVESDLKYTRARLEDRREELESLRTTAERVETLERTRKELTEEIADLRTRKERMKRRTRDAFEAAAADVLDRFDTGFEAARLTPNFDLVVARDGRETPLSALSEGEVELVGIVAALAGHEAYDVGEDVPVMLLDDLGGLSADNRRRLVSYLETRADVLVFTAYPEHDASDANAISTDEWTVVSREGQA